MAYMKLLMDADCLIKLTKAGLKELVAENAVISIPETVRYEVVEAGKIKGCADSLAVEQNIKARIINVIEMRKHYAKGDHAVTVLFERDRFDAVATDDTRLTRQLRALGIPFILPGLIIHELKKEERMSLTTAHWALDQLATFISEDELSMTKLLLEKDK
jgi:rRNA-processing protein FCF1